MDIRKNLRADIVAAIEEAESMDEDRGGNAFMDIDREGAADDIMALPVINEVLEFLERLEMSTMEAHEKSGTVESEDT